MSQESSKALVPFGNRAPARADSSLVKLGTQALSLLAKSAPLRKAALAGAAFGIGYQVSRMAQRGGVPRLADDVRDVYRALNGDHEAEGRLVGGWVRESVTIVSTVYEMLGRDDEDQPR